jgi:hypothetical protein
MILATPDSESNDFTHQADSPGRERRIASRAQADFVVHIEFAGREANRAWALDIGLGGMFIETDDIPDYATPVFVTIGDPLVSPAIRIPAIVRWSTAHGFGVQFGLLGVRETHALLALTAGLTRFEEEAVTVMRRTLCS